VLRGLITWQWAPDCRPARQAGQLLGLTRLGSIFSLTDLFGSSIFFASSTSFVKRVAMVCVTIALSQKEKGRHACRPLLTY
jgi:hypothetical protein